MEIKLKESFKPVTVKSRTFSIAQQRFMKDKLDLYGKLRLGRKNNSSSWVRAPLIVPKPGPEKFTFTVELRPLNRQTVPCIWSMPQIESSIVELSASKIYATLDYCQGYWQMSDHPDSQQCCSFIAPEDVYTSSRVLPVLTNAVTHIRSEIYSTYSSTKLRECVIKWLDDILTHAMGEIELIHALRNIFEICRVKNLKLHAKNVNIFKTEATWCGRIISKNDVRMDPGCLQGHTHKC